MGGEGEVVGGHEASSSDTEQGAAAVEQGNGVRGSVAARRAHVGDGIKKIQKRRVWFSDDLNFR